MSEIESGERWIRSYEDSWQYKCGQLCVRFMFTKVKVAVDLRQRAHLEWLSETRCLSASSTVGSSIYDIVCAVPQLTLPHVTMVLCEHSRLFQIPWLRRLHYNALLNCCRQFVLDSTFSPTFIILPFTSHKLANIIGSSWAPYTEYVSIVSIVTVVTTRKHCDCVSTASIDSSQKTSFHFFQARRLSPFFSWPRSIWEGFPVKSGWNHLLRGEQSFLSDMKCQAMK